MKDIISFFYEHRGYGRMKDLKQNGYHTRDLAKEVEKGMIEKIKPGLYKLVNFPWDEHNWFVDIAKAKKHTVICLTSALSYYELSTFNPSLITVAVPQNTDKFHLDYPPIKVYYFSDSMFQLGVEEVTTQSGSFHIYNPEKTLCDMFRYRHNLGEDIALEGLKNYLNLKNSNINKLLEYAGKCRIKSVIEPYVKAMVAR